METQKITRLNIETTNIILEEVDQGPMCPKCGHDDIWMVDCPDCDGLTERQTLSGHWVSCDHCNAKGYIAHNYHCSECHHVWELK